MSLTFSNLKFGGLTVGVPSLVDLEYLVVAGGGGGGGGGSTNQPAGASGGSGVVILKYSVSLKPAITTGSPTITITNGYRIYKFNSSGTITFLR